MPSWHRICAVVAMIFPKTEPRKRVRGRKTRAEATVTRDVRVQCFQRDGTCRLGSSHARLIADIYDDKTAENFYLEPCHWDSEWAHLASHRRSKTRGQAAIRRHTSAGSLILCPLHHDQYDGRQRPRLYIRPLTDRGADGPLEFTRTP